MSLILILLFVNAAFGAQLTFKQQYAQDCARIRCSLLNESLWGAIPSADDDLIISNPSNTTIHFSLHSELRVTSLNVDGLVNIMLRAPLHLQECATFKDVYVYIGMNLTCSRGTFNTYQSFVSAFGDLAYVGLVNITAPLVSLSESTLEIQNNTYLTISGSVQTQKSKLLLPGVMSVLEIDGSFEFSQSQLMMNSTPSSESLGPFYQFAVQGDANFTKSSLAVQFDKIYSASSFDAVVAVVLGECTHFDDQPINLSPKPNDYGVSLKYEYERDQDGWLEISVRYSATLNPLPAPFYGKPWFIVLMVFSVAVAIYLVYFIIKRRKANQYSRINY